MPNQNPIDVNVFDLVTFHPTQPAAGASYSLAVNANARWQVLSVQFALATDATVATRIMKVHGNDGTGDIYLTSSNEAQAASLTAIYSFNVGVGVGYAGGAGSRLVDVLNTQMFLRQGDTLNITIDNIQVGDQISNIHIRLKQWITEN